MQAQVEDCSRLLACDILHLDPSCNALARQMNGKVCVGKRWQGAVRAWVPPRAAGRSMLHWRCTSRPPLQVLRPWCHFELPESDYVSSGRRNPDMPGPSGAIEPLDTATKVGSHGSDCRPAACGRYGLHAPA